ncbi:MAG: phosphotransferase [Deltaproteobacteria bacterium]|nr:phosphotransferase [Deltaproteobacteria bacterium]
MRPFTDLTPRGQLRRLHALATEALRGWALPREPTLRLLNHGENTVYGVRTPGTPELHVLRIHRSDYHPMDHLVSEARWLDYLQGEGIGAPAAERDIQGNPVRHVQTEGMPEGRHVTLLRKTPGRMRDYDHWGPTHAAEVGKLLARMHRAAERFEAPAGFSRRVLDAEGLVGPTASWGDPLAEPLLDKAGKDLFAWGRDRLFEELGTLPRDRTAWGMTHTDLHGGNVLFADGVAKAIDFDDLAHAWFVSDFAVNLVPVRWRNPDLADGMLAGYRSVRPLSDEALAALPTFHCARRMMGVAWARSRADVPRLIKWLPWRIQFAMRTLQAWKDGDDPLLVKPD